MLKTIIIDNQQNLNPEVWERALKLPVKSGKIITLAGVRRSGKTYHLFNLMNQLKAAGVPGKRLVYLNFEDERLNFSSQDLDLILQGYQELYSSQKLSECFFFFDEIQEVDGWEKFVSRVYASVSRNIFITGSNAKLLSKEIATALRGRTVTFEIYPLSFAEFARIQSPKLNLYSSADKAKLANLFNRFMHQGGFPELVKQKAELKDKILQEFFNVLLLRDLIERYDIGNSAALKYFCKRAVAASAGQFSVNKIYHEFKSQGYQISKDSLYAYQDYVETVYLNRFVNKYSHSVIKAENSLKKIYVIDQGLGSALDYKFSQDTGRLLETTVALELLKQDKQIAYWQNGGECDFVIIDKGRVSAAIQVTAEMAEVKTREREIKGLAQACQKFSLKEGIILTLDYEEQIKQEGAKILVLPAWQYFLTKT